MYDGDVRAQAHGEGYGHRYYPLGYGHVDLTTTTTGTTPCRASRARRCSSPTASRTRISQAPCGIWTTS
jgi:hypothetical protein